MTGKCRVCGCIDDQACEGGCTWVEPDLCSKCAANIEESKKLPATVPAPNPVRVRIRVSSENYKELSRLAGELQTKSGKRVTIDEVVTHLCKLYGQAGAIEPHPVQG